MYLHKPCFDVPIFKINYIILIGVYKYRFIKKEYSFLCVCVCVCVCEDVLHYILYNFRVFLNSLITHFGVCKFTYRHIVCYLHFILHAAQVFES